MKRFLNLIYMVMIAALMVSITACSDDDDDDDEPQTIMVTQSDIDGVTTLAEGDITGAEYFDFSHNPNIPSSDSTYRDVYTNMSNIGTTASPGDIVIKHVFKKNPDGSKGDLLGSVAMIKREAGYDAENGDWEYAALSLDGVDMMTNPNGLIAETEGDSRGKIQMCIGCHSGGTSDYRWVGFGG